MHKRIHPNRGRIEAIDADEYVTLVDAQVDLGTEDQGRTDDVSAVKDTSVAEPTVFDDEEVTMTMAQTLNKIKAKKARILDDQMAKRLQDEEIEQAAAKEKQEKEDLEKTKMQEKHLDNIKKYQILKRKLISVAQSRKNMIVYLKNMVGYKIAHFKGLTYDQVKEYQEKDKIGSKPDKNGKRGEARKSQKQLQSIKQEKLKKTQVEGAEK
nr:hypothetical protein [Tanacetum cinerariifolium]